MINIAGGAESLADGGAVWLARPGFGLASGKPVACGFHECFAKGRALADRLDEAGEAVCRAENIGVAVGQGDMLFDSLSVIARWESCDESWGGGETSNVFIRDAAFEEFFAGSVAIEESTMVFLKVGIAMPVWGQHESDVVLGPEGRVVFSCSCDLLVEGASQFKVNGAFARFEVLVVVDVSLPPELSLIVQDVCFLANGCELGAPEDTVGVMGKGGLVGGEIWVVSIQCFAIIIPVDWHGDGVRS